VLSTLIVIYFSSFSSFHADILTDQH